MTCYSDLNLQSGSNIKTEKADPLTKRRYYAISTFAEEFIFVSGGVKTNTGEELKTVEFYNIQKQVYYSVFRRQKDA